VRILDMLQSVKEGHSIELAMLARHVRCQRERERGEPFRSRDGDGYAVEVQPDGVAPYRLSHFQKDALAASDLENRSAETT
jgi:hypothetical protein